jgi:hypothetical protein
MLYYSATDWLTVSGLIHWLTDSAGWLTRAAETVQLKSANKLKVMVVGVWSSITRLTMTLYTPPACLSICLSVCPSWVCLFSSVCVSVNQSVSQSVCPSISQCNCQSDWSMTTSTWSIYISAYIFVTCSHHQLITIRSLAPSLMAQSSPAAAGGVSQCRCDGRPLR